MRKEQAKKIYNAKGITLIALVITIIVLLIISGVAISALTGSGLFENTQNATKKYKRQEINEKINLEYATYQIDKISGNSIKTFFEYLEEKGYAVDFEDENQGTMFINGEKYSINIVSGKISTEYVGEVSEADLNKPKFISQEAIVEGTTVNISATLKEEEGVTYTYSIKKETDENDGTEQSTSEFNDLLPNTTYIVTIKAKNEYGTTIRRIKVKTLSLAELTEGKASFSLSATTKWQSSVQVTIDTTYSGDANIKLQYRIGEEGDYVNYPEGGFTLRQNGNLYGRYYDTVAEEVGYTFALNNIDIIDSVDPQEATITLSATSMDVGGTITAEVTHTDNETEIAIENCKYIVNDSQEAIGKDADAWNSATAFTTNPQTLSITQSTGGTYYLHVLSTDIANNKTETVSDAIRFKASQILYYFYDRSDLGGMLYTLLFPSGGLRLLSLKVVLISYVQLLWMFQMLIVLS